MWTARHLTTTALARRLLDEMGVTDVGSARVLFVATPGGWPPRGTYDEGGNLRDMLFHGLRALLGARCVDAERLNHMYGDALDGEEAEELEARAQLHAFGFFHAVRPRVAPPPAEPALERRTRLLRAVQLRAMRAVGTSSTVSAARDAGRRPQQRRPHRRADARRGQGHLDAAVQIDRGRLEERIAAREFSLVVFASVPARPSATRAPDASPRRACQRAWRCLCAQSSLCPTPLSPVLTGQASSLPSY